MGEGGGGDGEKRGKLRPYISIIVTRVERSLVTALGSTWKKEKEGMGGGEKGKTSVGVGV